MHGAGRGGGEGWRHIAPLFVPPMLCCWCLNSTVRSCLSQGVEGGGKGIGGAYDLPLVIVRGAGCRRARSQWSMQMSKNRGHAWFLLPTLFCRGVCTNTPCRHLSAHFICVRLLVLSVVHVVCLSIVYFPLKFHSAGPRCSTYRWIRYLQHIGRFRF